MGHRTFTAQTNSNLVGFAKAASLSMANPITKKYDIYIYIYIYETNKEETNTNDTRLK